MKEKIKVLTKALKQKKEDARRYKEEKKYIDALHSQGMADGLQFALYVLTSYNSSGR